MIKVSLYKKICYPTTKSRWSSKGKKMWQTIEDMKTRKSTNNFLIWYKKMREDKITKERIIEQKMRKCGKW